MSIRVDMQVSAANTFKVKSLSYLGLMVLMATPAVVFTSKTQEQPGMSPSMPQQLRLTPQEKEAYERTKTLLDWTPQQIRSFPLLHKLQPASSQDFLPAILNQVGKTALERFQEFPKIACDEEITSYTTQRGVHMPGTLLGNYATVHQFRYIIIPKIVADIPLFEEYRTDTRGRNVNSAKFKNVKMLTSNFAGNWLYFTPSNQKDSRFRYFGTASIQNRQYDVVGFAQKPDARNVSGFKLADRSAPLPFQGLAWIDAQTHQVLKMQTWLLAPLEDIQLQRESTLVEYSPVLLAGFEKTIWLPRKVTVEIVFRGAFFSNEHHYSKYKLFRVESVIKPVE